MMFKSFTYTPQSKSGRIFFVILTAYHLLLGFYLIDFLVLSPMLLAFYLLSALPTLFFLIRILSPAMRATVYTILFFVLLLSLVSFVYCRRFMLIMVFFVTAVEMLYLAVFDSSSGKDTLLTKIIILTVSALIVIALSFSYNFVFKPETPCLSNGGATLWDAQTEELADEICAGCDTDEERVQTLYLWILQNFTYDYEADPFIQFFDIRRTLRTGKGVCYDFSHLFAALCRSQKIPCYVIDGASYKAGEMHTWNRVYYDGYWWNMDITHDITSTAKGITLYGFRKIEDVSAPDEDFSITKIY